MIDKSRGEQVHDIVMEMLSEGGSAADVQSMFRYALATAQEKMQEAQNRAWDIENGTVPK
jgi:hypothetical protein